MYKLCKTEQSATRQREVEEQLLSLLETKNYDDITVSELASRSGVPRKAFYRYFDTKEDVVMALVDHTLVWYEGFSKGRAKTAKRTATTELEMYFSFWLSDRPRRVLRAMLKQSLEGFLIQRSIIFSSVEMKGLARFMSPGSDADAGHTFCFIITGLMSVMISWFKGGCKESTFEMARVAQRLVTQPLFPNLESFGISRE